MTMDQETAHYVFTYFGELMSEQERKAWRHYASTIKLGPAPDEARVQAYRKKGWLTDDPDVLDLLAGGIEQFELNTATRIFKDHQDKVLFNNCPQCGRLARTPKARQCRHCGHDWHNGAHG